MAASRTLLFIASAVNLTWQLATALATGALFDAAAPPPPDVPAQHAAALEDIFVLHSVRMERQPKSTWCTPDRTGFAPAPGASLVEDRFTMWSVRVQAQDGRIDAAKAGEVGPLRACFGSTPDPTVVDFYAEATLAGLAVAGNGACHRVQADLPEKGISSFRCHLVLRGLAPPYTGGLLTTSSLVSQALIGAETEPSGYLQTSIATVRLWRVRAAH